MKVFFSSQATHDYLYLQKCDRGLLRRVNALINAIAEKPFDGLGAPVSLAHGWKGYWVRRVDRINRLVYKIGDDGSIYIAQCRYHR